MLCVHPNYFPIPTVVYISELHNLATFMFINFATSSVHTDIKRKIKRRLIYECQCDERLKAKT